MESKWVHNEILESEQMGFFSLNREWKFTNLSLQDNDIIDQEPRVLIGKVIWEEFPELIGTSIERVYREVMGGDISQRIEICGKNTHNCYNTLVQPSVDGIFISWNDLSMQRSAEEALRISEEKYRLLFNSIDQGFFLIDVIFDESGRPVDMYYVEANAAAKRILGNDFTGKRLKEIDPSYESYWFEIFGEVALTGESKRMEQYAEPDKKWYSFYIFKIDDEKNGRIGNIFLDITERKRLEVTYKNFNESALRKSEEKFRMLFEKIDEGFCIIEMIFDSARKPIDYRFIEANPAFENQTGLHHAEGKRIRDLKPDHEEYWFEIYGKVALTGNPIRFINEAKAFQRWYDVYAFRIEPYNNFENAVAILFTDVTKSVSEKNELENSLRVMDDVFANISHELKTPLNVIHSTNQMMEIYLKSDSIELNRQKMLRGINTIKQNCYRFTRLINNIVDLSKMDSGFFKLNMRNTNIVKTIENIVQSVAEYVKEKELSILFNSNIDEKIIACDAEMIERVLLNLISNAIKNLSRGGKIFIDIADNDDYVQISIIDTGDGIDENNLEKIFKRFQQVDRTFARKAEGTGIGLSLAKSIIEMHDGKISVESVVGKGSTFRILLPVRIMEEEPKPMKQTTLYNDKIELINIEFSDIYR